MQSKPQPDSVNPGVYIKPQELIDLRALKNSTLLQHLERVQHPMPGDGRSSAIGRGIEFSEIRTYQPGDDVRSIDWRLSARTGKTYSRVYAEDRDRHLHLLVDQRAAMFFGTRQQFKSVLAAKLAAHLAWSALDAGYRIGGCIMSNACYRIRSQRSRSSIMQLLNVISAQNNALSSTTETTVSLAAGIQHCVDDTRAGARVVVISDFRDLDERTTAILLHAAQLRRWILIGVFDPVERKLPNRGLLGISDGLRRAKARLNRNISSHCAQLASQHRQHIDRTAALTGNHVLWMSTADTLDENLAAFSATRHGE